TPHLYVDEQMMTGFSGEEITIDFHYHNVGEIQWCRLGSSCVTWPNGALDNSSVTIKVMNSRVFTVTLSGLRTENSGWYLCAKGDLQMPVHITVTEKQQQSVSGNFIISFSLLIFIVMVRWDQWGELALGGFSGLGAAALFLMTFIRNWVCYAGYIVFKCLYMLLITIAMYQIAADLTMERYALTIITSVVVDGRGLGLGIIPQFTIYASYFSLIAVLFSLRGLFTIWRSDTEPTAAVRKDPPDCDKHTF
ncbi:hypothetical protein KUCAC02_006024, partial [Chaenocephalus aceratus]